MLLEDTEWQTIPFRSRTNSKRFGSSKRGGGRGGGRGRKSSSNQRNLSEGGEAFFQKQSHHHPKQSSGSYHHSKAYSKESRSSTTTSAVPANPNHFPIFQESSKIAAAAANSAAAAVANQRVPYATVLTDLVPSQQSLHSLKSSLYNAWQLSFQSKDLHQEIMATLEFYTLKIKSVVSSKNIWQAPSSDQLLYRETNHFSSTSSVYIDPNPNAHKKGLYSSLVATPAEEPHLLNPTPLYSSTQLPSFLFEGIQLPGKRLLRTRSTSWSTPIRPPGFEYSPKRLLSPPFVKKTTDLEEIKAKQEKAQEIRDLIIAAKLKKQKEKTQAVEQRLNQQEEIKEEQRKQLKESIDEKLSKAEKLRTEHLRNIQNKAKVEELKRDEIQQTTQQIIQNKKLEVETKLQESELRKLELDDEKLRRTSGVLALQEAATKRRKDLAQQKLEKLARKEEEGKQRVELLAEEQNRRIAMANEKKNRVQSRVQELESKKNEIEQEKKRALLEKLEQSAQRKEDQVRQVREKAALANQNAKIVASRVQSTRKCSESNDPGTISALLSPTLEALTIESDESKALKKKLKKIKNKLQSYTNEYSFSGKAEPSFEERKMAINLLQSLSTSLRCLDSSELVSVSEKIVAYMDDTDYIYEQLCGGGVLEELIVTIEGLRPDNASELQMLMPCIAILEKATDKELVINYICQSPASITIQFLDFLLKMIPFCSYARPTSPEILSTIQIMKITKNCIKYCQKTEFLSKIGQQIISYAFANGCFEKLKLLYALVHGVPESLDPFVPFVLASEQMLSEIIDFGNQKYFELPAFKTRKLSQQALSVLNFCLDSNMVGLITLLDSILLSISGSYRAAGQVILSENWVQLSLLTFQTLNKICLLNTKMVQNWLASRNQITELFHLVLFWMQYFSTQQYPKALYPIIDELVVLVGYVTQGHAQNTQMVCVGLPGPNLLQRFCQLPFPYFNTPRGRSILFPTLIGLAVDENNRPIIEESVNMDFFRIFLLKNKALLSPDLLKTIPFLL